MMVPFVDLKEQYQSIKTEIDSAISKVIDQTSFVGGPTINDFELKFASLLNVKYCIGVANGTDAIYIALKMLGIGSGDEVITTALSWISTSETITQAGAKPVFSDIDPVYYTIDPSKIEEKITPRTKAIIPVHLYGHAAQMNEIQHLCSKYKLFLIEDCAQAHLTAEDSRYVGNWGDVGTFSFYPGKNLGAYGDAGAIVTNDTALASRMRMYANHGALKKHQHQIEGINSRLDTIQAAVLKVKLSHLEKWTKMRIANAFEYDRQLNNIGDIHTPKTRNGTTHTFHLYVIRTNRRDQLKAFLESKGIQTAIHYPKILPNLPAYKYLNTDPRDFPVANAYEKQILSLPMFPELTSDQINYVCSQIREFFD